LDVDDGWDRAVETVLGQYLQAVCVADVADAATSIARLRAGNVTLLQNEPAERAPEAGFLAGKVRNAPAAIDRMLRSVRIAETMAEALSIRAQLQDGE